jgi:hypothetical protein
MNVYITAIKPCISVVNGLHPVLRGWHKLLVIKRHIDRLTPSMSGKNKGSKVVHREAFERMNFLYQVRVACVHVNAGLRLLFENRRLTFVQALLWHYSQAANLSVANPQGPVNPGLARFYLHSMKTIAKRIVLRMCVKKVVKLCAVMMRAEANKEPGACCVCKGQIARLLTQRS